jgi:transglutaminase-like putative cysteine protease
MDFHAWFEAWIDGAWRTFDARHNFPRIGRVLIATGRDAVDTAFNTSYGSTRLAKMKVWADQVAADFRLERPHT